MMSLAGAGAKQIGPKKRKEWFWAYLFIAPTVVGLFVFLIGPIFYSFYISTTVWDNLSPPKFIGLGNYVRMFQDPNVFLAIRNTLFYTVISVPFTVIIALVVASFLSMDIPGIGFFRAAIFIPYVTLPAAAAMVWENMFNVKFGMINGLLKLIGMPSVPWLTKPDLVMLIVIAMGVWMNVGYFCVILLVGIKNLSRSYYEAAKIDGANAIQCFTRITIPLLTPQIFFVTTMAVISAFKVFDAIFVFGKASSATRDGIRTMVFDIYERGFTFHEMGYASAEAILLLAIIMVVTVIQFASQKKWVHY